MRHKQAKSMACTWKGAPWGYQCHHLVALVPTSCPDSKQESAGRAMPFKGTEEVGLKLRSKRQGRSVARGVERTLQGRINAGVSGGLGAVGSSVGGRWVEARGPEKGTRGKTGSQ